MMRIRMQNHKNAMKWTMIFRFSKWIAL